MFSACRRSRLRPIRSRPPSARWTATGATGTAGKATRVSGCSFARRRSQSGPRSPSFNFETRAVFAHLPAMTVASIYVPNGGKDFPAKLRFLEAMDAHAQAMQASGVPIVLCGDLNVARTEMDVHPKERKPLAIGQLPEERDLLERIISRGLVDLGRALDPDNDRLFTWWPPWRNMRQRNIGWRLDYILASHSLAGAATRCPVYREVGTSDHGPVVAEFDTF